MRIAVRGLRFIESGFKKGEVLKVLFLTSRFPYPPFRGDKLRAFNFIRELSKEHEVHLVSFVESEDVPYIEKMEEICSNVSTVFLNKRRSYLNCVTHLASKKPFQIFYYESPVMRVLIDRLVKDMKPDVIHAHLLRMAPYAEVYDDLPKVLDLCDSISLNYQRFLKYRRDMLSPVYRIEQAKMKRYETEIPAKFDASIVIAEHDKRYLEDLAKNNRFSIVKNGVDFDYFQPQDEEEENGGLAFMGTMSYFPNSDGAIYFCREILPLIRQKKFDIWFNIIGNSPTSEVKALAKDGNVNVTGFVDDVRPLVRSSSVFVCPIRAATGLNNKVVEAMAMGIPVVATPQATDGIGVHPGEDILVADEPKDFSEKVLMLLKDAALRDKISRNGLRLVRENYDWKINTDRLIDIYTSVVKRETDRKGSVETDNKR